jgi:stage III sporulation protein SpoIIIAA
MEQSRSTWQMWHVRAEAQRQVRAIDMPSEHAASLVDLLVDEVLDRRSVALAAPADNIEGPDTLRRVDGSSVYAVAGADLYTSTRILDAECRLVAAAGRGGGTSVDETAMDLALLEMAANGTAVDAGQAALVRHMCTSGSRLQLAIAPAGAGKTTAMRALTLAWTQDGGHLLGLAPSAAAAAVLSEQTGIRADTLAKLIWSLQHGELPEWAAAVGPSTLVIIDEAGMADTLSLDTAVQSAIHRGASVRLVGDDQQLAAIGAGGVLRDIQQSHGALRLTELHRFTNPTEATASLALREGQPEALDFYLDHGRIHVGDVATTSKDAFSAWVSDRAAGLDTIMIAPTRDLVAELNRRARAHRLDHSAAASEVSLADGNQASVGDVIITRANDRRLRVTATDWVKNGDRWTVTQVGKHGDITVRHTRSHLTVRLPFDYVSTSTGLGYATTIHAAQGVTAATMHGLALDRSHASSCTRCSPAAGSPTTSTCRSSATATSTPSSDPKQSHPAPRPRPCSRSSPATTRPLQPPHCCENSATLLPGSTRPSSATPTASTWQSSSSSDPRSFTRSTAKPSRSSLNSRASRRGRPSEHTCSRWRLRPGSTHSSTCRQPPPEWNSIPPATWPPCSTGASQSPHLPTQDHYLASRHTVNTA